jgi:hypothetical protein
MFSNTRHSLVVASALSIAAVAAALPASAQHTTRREAAIQACRVETNREFPRPQNTREQNNRTIALHNCVQRRGFNLTAHDPR